MVLSLAGLILAMSGAGVFLAVFVDSSGLRLQEDYVANVLQQPEEIYKILLGLGGLILGGILVLGGFLWSLENAMKRWRTYKSQPTESPELSGME